MPKKTSSQAVEQTVNPENQSELIAMLLEKVALLEQQQNATVEDNKEEYVDIRPDSYIQLMSLCSNKLNLSTGRIPPFKKYSFESFGDVKRVPYQQVVEIIENHPTFTEEGIYYILNKDVIRRHGLDDAYAKILDKEQIESIFDSNPETAFSLYESANNKQKGIIVDMLIQKMVQGENIDMNLIHRVSKSSGRDISTIVDEAKEIMEEVLEAQK